MKDETLSSQYPPTGLCPPAICSEGKSRTQEPQIPQSYQAAVTAMSSHQTLTETGSTVGVTRGTPRHCAP